MVATTARTRRPAPRKSSIKIEVGKTTFYATLADSRSLYTVMKSRGGDTYDCEVKAHPEHGTQIDWLGHKKVFGGEEIRSSIAHDRALDSLFASADNFWASRRIGEVLHYHDSFGRYVRGIVVDTPKGKQMRATALVGNWTGHDLPKRGPDGEVRVPYQVKKIREGDTWAPNESCVYEAEAFSRKRDLPDPRKMPALDISDPAPLEGEAAEAARYEKMRMDISRVLSEGYRDPKEALTTAYEMLIVGGIK